jgi:biopolymer transport protein ExbD
MAMSVGGDDQETMSDINTTPLVDVMLVLLIIFIIAVPVVVQSVKMKLPDVRFEPTSTKPENVSLSIIQDEGGGCAVFWGMTRVTNEELLSRAVAKLKAEIERQGGVGNPDLELPEAHIRADVDTPYQCIGGAIYNMQMAGFSKVGFISEPPAQENSPRI